MPVNNKPSNILINVSSNPTKNGNDSTNQQSRPINNQTGAITFENSPSTINKNNIEIPTRQKKFEFISNPKTSRVRRELPGDLSSVAKKIPANSYSRILLPGVSSTHITDFSSTKIRSPLSKLPTLDIEKQKATTSSNLTQSVDSFLLQSAVSNLRPEIISVLDWIPSSVSNENIEKLIDIRACATLLQIENAQKIIETLESVNIGGIFSQLKSDYKALVEDDSQVWFNYRKDILDVLGNSKRALDIKDNVIEHRSQVESFIKNVGLELNTNIDTSLEGLFINKLHFSPEGYKRFSNSKVYKQLIFDLYRSCAQHSPNLIYSVRNHRLDDLDSVDVNEQFIALDKKYDFRLSLLGNSSTTSRVGNVTNYRFNSLNLNDYSKFISSLPKGEDDKIKVLVTSLANELNISAGMGKLSVTSPDPFLNYIGEVNNDIFVTGSPSGSLAYLTLQKSAEGSPVLPFEIRTFFGPDKKEIVPGSTAFVDNITQGNLENGFNYTPYVKFAQELNGKTNDLYVYLEDLLSLDKFTSKLHAGPMLLEILNKMQTDVSSIVSKDINQGQLIHASMLRLANKNIRVKHSLLRYILETRDVVDQVSKDPNVFLVPMLSDAGTSQKQSPQSASLSKFKALDVPASVIQKTYGTQIQLPTNQTPNYKNTGKIANEAAIAADAIKANESNLVSNKPQNTALQIASLIRESISNTNYVGNLTENSTTSVDKNSQNFNSINNTEIDERAIAASLNSLSGRNTVFSNIIKLAREFQLIAQNLSNEKGQNGFANNGLTRYNGWGEDSLISVIFEIYCTFYSKFIDANLLSNGSGKFYINSDYKKNNDFFSSLEKIQKEDKKNKTSSEASSSFSILKSIVKSLDEELEIKILLVNHLRSIGFNINKQADNIKRFFDLSNSSIDSGIKRYLLDKIKTQSGRDMLATLTEQQVALQRIAKKKYASRQGDSSYIPTDLIIEPEGLAALKSLINSPDMRGVKSDNIRIITVGVPHRAIDILQNPPYILGKNDNSELSNNKEIFEVHVHKHDLEFEDIVFKPRKFIFDKSIFLLSTSFSNLKLQDDTRINTSEVMDNVRFTVATFAEDVEKSVNDLLNDSRYTGLSTQKKQEIFKNHVMDKLLQMYYHLTGGLNIDENTFIKHVELCNLLIDPDAALLLRISQIDERTWQLINTDTVPVANLLIENNFNDENFFRIATLSDAEIFLRPTQKKLESLSREILEANMSANSKEINLTLSSQTAPQSRGSNLPAVSANSTRRYVRAHPSRIPEGQEEDPLWIDYREKHEAVINAEIELNAIINDITNLREGVDSLLTRQQETEEITGFIKNYSQCGVKPFLDAEKQKRQAQYNSAVIAARIAGITPPALRVDPALNADCDFGELGVDSPYSKPISWETYYNAPKAFKIFTALGDEELKKSNFQFSDMTLSLYVGLGTSPYYTNNEQLLYVVENGVVPSGPKQGVSVTGTDLEIAKELLNQRLQKWNEWWNVYRNNFDRIAELRLQIQDKIIARTSKLQELFGFDPFSYNEDEGMFLDEFNNVELARARGEEQHVNESGAWPLTAIETQKDSERDSKVKQMIEKQLSDILAPGYQGWWGSIVQFKDPSLESLVGQEIESLKKAQSAQELKEAATNELKEAATNYFVGKINEQAREEIRAARENYRKDRERFASERYGVEKPVLTSAKLQQFRMLCAAAIMSPRVLVNRILSPRIFDRVLMLAIDPDEFEVDIEKTNELLKQKSLQEREEFKQMIIEMQGNNGEKIVTLKPRRRSENSSSFNEFFVALATVGEDS